MPRRGEDKPKKGAKGKGALNLGRAIARQQFGASTGTAHAELETERGKHKLRSVTHCDDLEELMSNAVLAGTDFTARRGELVYVGQEARTERPRVRAPAELILKDKRKLRNLVKVVSRGTSEASSLDTITEGMSENEDDDEEVEQSASGSRDQANETFPAPACPYVGHLFSRPFPSPIE